jgi:prolyl oligopeptidase
METTRLQYPATRVVDQVDDHHGTKVADPYRWLEDLDSGDTREWIERQNELTFSYLAQIPGRDDMKKRLTELWDYERYGLPVKKQQRYFYLKNNGLQNQSVLYVTESLNGEPRVLLDPNAWSEDGTKALTGISLTDDGSLLAFSISDAGSDWQQWRVLDVETGEELSDRLEYIKFTNASFTADQSGFFYSRFPQPDATQTELKAVNQNQKIYFHRLGTDQSADELIYERPDHPDWYMFSVVTEDHRYLLIAAQKGTESKNALFYKDLGRPDSSVVELFQDHDASYSVAGNEGSIFWIHTDRDAPLGRVLRLDLARPDSANWNEIVPESEHTLLAANVIGGRLVCQYLKEAHSQVKIFSLDGSIEKEVDLPEIGTVVGFDGRQDDPETFFMLTSFTDPGTVFRYDVVTGEKEIYREPQANFDPASFETGQVFFQSKDGTRVPMFLVHKKGIDLGGGNPTILYGYGGFKAPLTPVFGPARISWLERGGIFAAACLRGGGEYGEQWYQDGRRHKKQNVFDDFIAAAEWLISERYTSTEKLAIEGASNGGLLVGACMTQRPELFGAVHCAVGVLDVLRFHKFTVGWGWISDYGTADDPDDFRTIYSYSPLQNLKDGTQYPATLITTGDHDDRVWPGHSLKFAAALQSAQAGPKPTLIRVETRVGHGLGKPTSLLIEEQADVHAFLLKSLGVI